MRKHYVGDGVYIEFDVANGAFVVTTENGIRATNTIVLEVPEALALVAYITRALTPVDKTAL